MNCIHSGLYTFIKSQLTTSPHLFWRDSYQSIIINLEIYPFYLLWEIDLSPLTQLFIVLLQYETTLSFTTCTILKVSASLNFK